MIIKGLTLRLGVEISLVLGLIFTTVLIITLLIKLRVIRYVRGVETVILELTPPPAPHNTIKATEEFFAVLRHVLSSRSWRERIKGQKQSIALEIVSTEQQGIRYLIRLPKCDQPVFLHTLSAFAPTVTAEEAVDYLSPADDFSFEGLLDLRQTGPRSYALKHNYSENSHDPIAYITNAISGLEDSELIALQLVLTPASDLFAPPAPVPGFNPSAVPSDLVSASLHKGSQPQIQTSIRIFIRTTTKKRFDQRLKGVRSALTAYSYEGYQSLVPRLDMPGRLRQYRVFAFRNRLPVLFSRFACYLASSELAALYHFPYGTAIQTEDMHLSRHTILPVPLDVKNQAPAIDVRLGENIYRGRSTVVGLTATERERHTYIIGGTGNGKSTLLQYAIVQDMHAGKGVAVIDPHGDLAEKLLSFVPEDRLDDVIYFNPSDIRYPIGLNLLEISPELTGDSLLLEKDLVTESVVSMFRKIFSTNDTSGHRIEYILRNAVQTALTLENPTLFTVYLLLNDVAFRKRAISTLENDDLKLFWREFARAGSYQQASMTIGITAKIGRFLFSASARRILEQPQSSINFDEIMDQGKILICNVSKGLLGEDTSELFGIMVMAKLQLATLRRANRPPTERRPFYVYVDEFQNFATLSFTQLLSEARKYRLFLTLAEQSTSQHSDPRLVDIIFANIGTVVAFRTSSRQDEQLLQMMLSPHVPSGALSRLPAYHFYVRIAAEVAQPPFSGRTVLLASQGDQLLAQMVIQASRTKYGRQAESSPQTEDQLPAEWLPTWQPLINGST